MQTNAYEMHSTSTGARTSHADRNVLCFGLSFLGYVRNSGAILDTMASRWAAACVANHEHAQALDEPWRSRMYPRNLLPTC